MILDTLANAARYASLNPGFRAGFHFLSRSDLLALPSGRHEIDGDTVFALVNRDSGRGKKGARFEAHRKYIDIQFLAEGQERIGWQPLAECRQITEPYDAARDIMFFGDRVETWIDLRVGEYTIFFPEDAHAPLAAEGDNVKVVIKVAV